MQRDIAIAELEPGVEPHLAPLRVNLPGLVRAAPALLRIGHARERIEHSIEVGANGRAAMLEVVPGIDDELQSAGRHAALQTLGQLGSADSSAKRDDPHGGLSEQ